ncbi:MAG: acyltransferase [Vicinamibacteria bacterium]
MTGEKISAVQESTRDRFYPALDGLRAVATFAVLISHFFPERSAIQKAFHWGRFGVLLFFVLSGFLITRLLLRGRAAIDSGESTAGGVFRTFVARRALRIAPIYYMVVLLGWAAGYGPIADSIGWHLTYTGNIALTYFHRPMAQATHLWSLCVEEQFYLLWPLAVLFISLRRLALLALAMVVVSTTLEALGTIHGQSFEQTHLVLQGCMDSLGLGALLAMARNLDGDIPRLAPRLVKYAVFVGAPLFFFAQGFRYQVGLRATDLLPYRVPGDLGFGMIALVLVHLATSSESSFPRRALEWAPLRFIGRISYGIYLYHLFLIAIGRQIARSYNVAPLDRGLSMFLIYSAVSIVLATLSWYLIEAPINRQKRHFPYPPSAGRAEPALLTAGETSTV